MAQEPETTGPNDPQTILTVVADPAIYEILYKVIADAQASGSVVLLAAIVPSAQSTASDGITPRDCAPKARGCPK